MRMIYCVRTTMVTSLSTNTTTTVINKPQLEQNVISVRSELNGPVNEARRLPEVTDEEDGISGTGMVSSPTVDAWKATIKDHKVIS